MKPAIWFYRECQDDDLFLALQEVCKELYAIEHELRRRWALKTMRPWPTGSASEPPQAS